MTKQTTLLYWYLPCEQDERRLQKVIDDLADAQGAPSFRPHLTLGASSDIEEPLRLGSSMLKAVTLTPIEIDGNEVFTTSLFMRFGLNDALTQARMALEQQPSFRQGRAFDPHMSLCYGPPPKGAHAQEDVRALLSNPVRFDRLATVSVELPVNSYDGVRAWRVLNVISV